MKYLVASMCAVLAAAPALAADAPKPLTAAQIVQHNVAARGGHEAWHAVNTLTMSGQLDAGGKKSTELPFVMKMKRGHKSRLEVRFADQTAVQVYDGAQGWKVRPFLGRNEVEPYTVAEAKQASAWEELDGPLMDYAAKGTKVQLVGTETLDERPAYRLRLTTKNGEQRNLWIDAETFLEVKIDGQPRRIDGRMRKVTIYYLDYKTENGLTTPRVLETAVEGVKQTRKMTIQRVAVNEPMEDELFAKPQLASAQAPAK